MADVLTLVIAGVVVVGLVIALRRNDGHWSSKDGLKFTCRVQPVDLSDRALDQARLDMTTFRPTSMFAMGAMSGGRARSQRSWGEARATIGDAGVHLLVRRGIARQVIGPCRILGRSTDDRDRVVFVVEGSPNYQMRVPASSPCVPHLTELIDQ